MSGFTPGPWIVDYRKPNDLWIHGQDGEWIANLAGKKADARLIAASPTLYEYVKKMADKGDKDATELIAGI